MMLAKRVQNLEELTAHLQQRQLQATLEELTDQQLLELVGIDTTGKTEAEVDAELLGKIEAMRADRDGQST